jgi:hypothetical protein
VATLYKVKRPFKHGRTHYRPGDLITGFTGWWRYWAILRYGNVLKVDPPSAPTALVATPGNTQASIAFTKPATDNYGPITGYKYRIDSGSWVSAGTTASPIVITGLTNAVQVSITLRAVNEAGDGTISSAVLVTPSA